MKNATEYHAMAFSLEESFCFLSRRQRQRVNRRYKMLDAMHKTEFNVRERRCDSFIWRRKDNTQQQQHIVALYSR